MDWEKVYDIIMKLLNITIILIIIWAVGEAAGWFTNCSNKNEIMDAKRNNDKSIPRCVTNIDMIQNLGLKFGLIYIFANIFTFGVTIFKNRSTNKALDELKRSKLKQVNKDLGGKDLNETENKIKKQKELNNAPDDYGQALQDMFDEDKAILRAERGAVGVLSEVDNPPSSLWSRLFRKAEHAR